MVKPYTTVTEGMDYNNLAFHLFYPLLGEMFATILSILFLGIVMVGELLLDDQWEPR